MKAAYRLFVIQSFSLLLITFRTSIGLCQDESDSFAKPDKKWRDPVCSYWIYSETGPLEKGFHIIVLDQPEELGPLDSDIYLWDYWNRKKEIEPTYDPHSFDIIVLATREVPSSTETLTLCRILHDMLFIEEWTPNKCVQRSSLCGRNKQNPELFDEALRRLYLVYPQTTIIDIYIKKYASFVDWATPD